MKLRSRGLGRKELIMDFRRYDIRRDGDEVLITGTITQPVTWDFSIRIEEEDIPGLVRVARSKAMVSLFFQWLGRIFKGVFTRRPEEEPVQEVGRTPIRRPEAAKAQAEPARAKAERRRKIEEARRRLEERDRRRATEAGGAPRTVAGVTPSAGGWKLARVGANPSGNGSLQRKEERSLPAGIGDAPGDANDEKAPAAAANLGGWNARRPGALPRVS